MPPKKAPKPPPRKPRADAQRNRARILEVAKRAFTRSGANVSLDDVARQTRIGAGTLYRHFPSRDALLEAVYRTEVEKLGAAEREFAESMPPVEALRAWMLLFVDYIATKQLIAPALNNMVGGTSKLFDWTASQIGGAIEALVKRAIETGDIRPDLDPVDLLRALIGVSNVASAPDWAQSAKRLVDILISGSRPVTEANSFRSQIKISRKADFAPSPPLATSAKAAKAQREEQTKQKIPKGTKKDFLQKVTKQTKV